MGPIFSVVGMTFQITLTSNLDYSKSIERIVKSKLVAHHVPTEKGLFEFYLKKFPDYRIQITPNSRIILFFERFLDHSEMLGILQRLLPGKNNMPLIFDKIKFKRPDEGWGGYMEFLNKMIKRKGIDISKAKEIVLDYRTFINYEVEAIVKNKEGKVIERRVKKADE